MILNLVKKKVSFSFFPYVFFLGRCNEYLLSPLKTTTTGR